MKILLHVCCAPCLIHPLSCLREKYFEVTGIFYNPNIQPSPEYINRRLAVEQYSKVENLEVIYPQYRPQEFLSAVASKESSPGRCEICWKLRLKETASKARLMNFSAFTTTLLVSPYQDQELLKDIGNQVAIDSQIQFYYEDFRPGFKPAHELAKARGIYCQKYCGCIYSISRKGFGGSK